VESRIYFNFSHLDAKVNSFFEFDARATPGIHTAHAISWNDTRGNEMVIRRSILLAGCAALLLAGCGGGGGAKDETGVVDAVGDTELLREAQAAANDLLRSASDCAAVEASYQDVVRKLDEVEGRIQTQTGRTTLAALRTQVGNVAQTCGVR
jgi:hypothetical protein